MMINQNLLVRSFAAATLILSSTLLAAQGLADGSSESVLEEVLVTGIRASLEQSIETKRNSARIVDSITSESIGKLPDSNIAESLQRITGVSIDRSGGEGKSVTVRGFGPEFNTVLLNGRRLVSDAGAEGGGTDSRAFNFDMLPAELVSGIDVYKSAPPSLQSGGIGATVVMHTARPLEIGERRVALSAKGLYESLSEEWTPQLFGMVSNTFADGTWGGLLSASYQERLNRLERFQMDGVITAPRDSLTLIADDLADQGYSADDQFFIPQNFNTSPIDENRKRTNINGTLQFQPNSALQFTLDALYAGFDVESKSNTLTFFVTPSIITAAEFDANRVATSLTQNSDAAVDGTPAEKLRQTDTFALGFNTEWSPSEQWDIAYDLSGSETHSNNADGTNVTVLGFRDNGFTLNYDERGIPSYAGPTVAQIQDASLYNVHFTMRGFGGGPLGAAPDIEHDIVEQRIDFSFRPELDLVTEISFGAYLANEQQSTTVRSSRDEALCSYCGYFVDVPDNLLRRAYEGKGFLDGEINVPDFWYTADIDEIIAYQESAEAGAARDAFLGLPPGATAQLFAETNGFDLYTRPDSTEIEEDIAALHLNFLFEGGTSIPWQMNAGLRYVETETTAIGIERILLDLISSGDPTLYQGVYGEETRVSQTNSYEELLPSIDFRANLTEELVGRIAASKTMTRPPFGALSSRTVIETTRPGNLRASSGNPYLEPYFSDNFDLSLEWYYQDGGYVSIGYFEKDVENFLVSTVVNEAIPIEDSEDLFTGDPVFEVRTTGNLEKSTVDGFELALQHNFNWLPGAWSGLGFSANATIVDSDAGLDVTDLTQTFALEGLSDTFNVIAYYEYGGWQARIAWNSRERFLAETSGFGGEPRFVQEFDQLDARFAYSFDNNLSVYVEGINLNDEKTTHTGRFVNQILLREQTGPRYMLGLSYEF